MKRTISISLFFVALLVSLFGVSYKDVPVNHWAYDAVMTVTELGIISGYPDGTFRGNDFVSRYQLAVAVYRVIEYMKKFGVVGSGTVSKDAISQIEQKVNALKDYISEKFGQNDMKFSELSSKMESFEMDVNNLMKVISDLNQNYDRLKRGYESLESTVTILQNTIENFNDSVSNLQSQLKKVQSKLKKVEDIENALEKFSTNVNGYFETLEKRVSRLETVFNYLKNDLEALRITNEASFLKVEKATKDIKELIEKKENYLSSLINDNRRNLEKLEKIVSELSKRSENYATLEEVRKIEEKLDKKTSGMGLLGWMVVLLTITVIAEGIYLLYLGGVFQ